MICDTLIGAEGYIKFTDKTTNEIILEKNNAIHFGNLSFALADAISGNGGSVIQFVRFGTGGANVDAVGVVNYKLPNVGMIYDASATLYDETYFKDVSTGVDPKNKIEVIPGTTNFTDIVITATLDTGEPVGQPDVDYEDTGQPMQSDFVFDEIGIFTNSNLMLTHVIFHPVQKSLNRIIELEYTLRIQTQ